MVIDVKYAQKTSTHPVSLSGLPIEGVTIVYGSVIHPFLKKI